MSRPPYPHPAQSTGGTQTGDLEHLDYLPLQYADLLGLEENLAVTKLGRPLTPAGGDVDEADVARTFMELSALVGHLLSVYQRYQAGEAFISTAQAPSSLVRHAHRLAYDPDPGLAASGYVVLVTKPLVAGTIAAGLPLASAPLGEIKAQDYETGDDLAVDAALNEIVPVAARRPVTISAETDELRVPGVGHGLEPGDAVALVGPQWTGLVVTKVTEEPDGATTLRFDRPVGVALDPAGDPAPVLLARPALALQPFGADADPALYPPAEIREAGGTEPVALFASAAAQRSKIAKSKLAESKGGATKPSAPVPAAVEGYWYTVARADGTGYNPADVYLSEKVADLLVDGLVLGQSGSNLAVLKVTAENVAAVTLNRKETQWVPIQTPDVTAAGKDRFTITLTDDEVPVTVTSHISGTVTALRLADAAGNPVLRTTQPFPADWLAGWSAELALAADEPNPVPAVEPLDLPGLLAALAPGRPLVFTDLNDTVAQVVAIRRAELDESAGVTRIWWDAVTDPPPGGWYLDDLRVLGNVARVSHGRTVLETLGGSDGVSPFQRFALRESPVTVLPGVAGGEPELEVRVNDVLWERVQDFADSGPDDRHYRIVTDETLVTSVVFGDGRNGAVPPSGKKNITAVYRVGLGVAGDVEPRRLSRLKRAHPLLDRAVNLTAVSGGAEPADAAAIRAQSTRWIRTFDRAVSASDLADLALTMPGIARAASSWDQAHGATLVVATAEGGSPAALDAVRAFLDARRDVTVPLVVRGPRTRSVRLTVNLEPDPAYLAEAVKGSIRQALHGDDAYAPGLFTFAARGLGQPAFLSEVYARLEAVEGVVGVRVDGFDADGSGLVADVIPAGVDEWLSLDPNDLTVSTLAPGSPA